MNKVIFFAIFSVALSGCSAVLKNSGYSSANLVEEQKCESFSYSLDSVVYWKRFDMMGPFIPLFPSWNDSKSFGLSLKATEGVELNETFCPILKINGVQQEFSSFDGNRTRCSYNLLDGELGETIKLEIEHLDCKPKEIIIEKYEKWDYVPPFMVTV